MARTLMAGALSLVAAGVVGGGFALAMSSHDTARQPVELRHVVETATPSTTTTTAEPSPTTTVVPKITTTAPARQPVRKASTTVTEQTTTATETTVTKAEPAPDDPIRQTPPPPILPKLPPSPTEG